jgi:pimeloyl-ACP methyl ester carboxylesterase
VREIVIAALATAGAFAAVAPVGAHPDWLRGCEVEGVDSSALCGTYDVWENRETSEGRRIGINVVVLPALGTNRAPDPLFFFRGGPGAGATGAVGRVSRLLSDVHQRRDLVFVDVRGTGESNPLRCRKRAADAPLQDHFREFLPDDYVRDCLARQDADVAWYTTPIAIDDVEEVRVALGYGPINLYGSSGGTRQEQLYLRRHPGAVRTAIMQGVAPLDAELPLPFGRALETGVEAVIAACAADSDCNAAYPDLAADWERSKRLFDDGPVAAEVEHPQTGRRGRVEIDRGVYADGVRHILYSVANASRLPGMIHLAGRGDFDAFAQRELLQNIGFDRIIAMGALMSATCAERARSSATTAFGGSLRRALSGARVTASTATTNSS